LLEYAEQGAAVGAAGCVRLEGLRLCFIELTVYE
jgi:predicted house-cleaning NTP pyrophosphatase (Maf/HAM1 superfamily)